MRLKKQYLAAAVTLGIMNWTTYSEAAFDENLNEYTLDAVVVEADATKDQLILLQNSLIIVQVEMLK